MMSKQAFRSNSHLYKDVDKNEWRDYQSCEGCGQQQNDADLQQLKQVSQHHLQSIRYHAVYSIDLFGEAVEEVSTRCHLKERHR